MEWLPSKRPGVRLRTGFAVGVAVTLTTLISPVHAATATTTSSAATTVTSPNLIVDPDAEAAAQCSSNGLDGMTLPGWTITSGEPNAVCYGAPGFPSTSTPGSADRGNQFFDGGGTGNSGLTQTADVSAAASAVDAGGVPVNLSGWLGGNGSDNGRAGVTATFQNAAGAALGSVSLLPVTPVDRGNTTELLQRSAAATLPAGTRAIKVDLSFTWDRGNVTDGYADDLSLTIGASLPAPKLTAPSSSVPGFDHVFLVMMENQNYGDIIGNSAAPYINSLTPKATVLTQSYGITHPSDPNYVALAAGGLYNLRDNSIGTTTINAPNLGDSVGAANKTWKSYVENESGNCDYGSHGYYSPDDVPFTFFQSFKSDESTAGYCAQHDQPLSQMTADLASPLTTPNFVWFEPDDCDDMEACGITEGDSWLSHTLPTIFNSPAWTQQRSLLILTFDEGDTKAFGPSYPNQVPTLLLGSQGTVKQNYYSPQRTDHYGLTRTVDQALGLAPLTNNDAYAATVNDAWSDTSPNGHFAISDLSAPASVDQGAAVTATVVTTRLSDPAQTVTLSATGLPAGTSATFNPPTVPAGGTSVMTVRTSDATPASTSTISITGTTPTETHSTSFTLTVSGTITALANDSDAAITYTGADWFYAPNRGLGDYGNDVHATWNNGDAATFTFTGTGVKAVGETNSDQGSDEIYIDGIDRGPANTQTPVRHLQQVIYSADNLAPGTHTIKVVKTSGTFMTIDAFAVTAVTFNDADPAIAYAGSGWWDALNRGLGDYRDDAHVTTTNGDTATVTFYGTGISYYTETNWDEGQIAVSLDGQSQSDINAYSATRSSQTALYTISHLAMGPHTLTLTKKTGIFMLVDRFDVS